MDTDTAVARVPVHTRRVVCVGYARADGCWDVEAHLVDTRTDATPRHDGSSVAPGGAVHDMRLRLTLDAGLRILAARASTAHAPLAVCAESNAAYAKLVGLRIAPGLHRQVRQLLGPTAHCTHLTELLYPLATTALQTVTLSRPGTGGDVKAALRAAGAAALVDSCRGWRSDSPAVADIFPLHYTGPRRDD